MSKAKYFFLHMRMEKKVLHAQIMMVELQGHCCIDCVLSVFAFKVK